MSKRNFILLIIVLLLVIIGVFGFLVMRPNPTTPGDNSTGTNFFTKFNPFGAKSPGGGTTTPPADVSGYVPPTTVATKLTKVSSMPIAGYAVFSKERLKDIPVVMLSNLGQKEDVDKAIGLGAEDFMVKANFTLDEIVAKIRSIVG